MFLIIFRLRIYIGFHLKEIHTVPNNRSISKDVYDSKLAILCMVFIKLAKFSSLLKLILVDMHTFMASHHNDIPLMITIHRIANLLS